MKLKAKNYNVAVILTTFALLMSACSTFSGAESKENLSKLRYGMEESQVLSLLGTPDSVIKESEVNDRWIYEFKAADKKGRNMFIQFRNGNLIRSGEISGRDVAAYDDSRNPGTCTHRVHPEVMQESLCVR